MQLEEYFRGKGCIFTGAASGFGFAVSEALLHVGAVVGLSECLRFELEDEGIQISVVCPRNVASRIFGTPILGERVEAKPPADAIPAAEAAKTILEGVAHKEGIIVFPEKIRQMWRQYWSFPEDFDNELKEMAQQRRRAYLTKGSYY